MFFGCVFGFLLFHQTSQILQTFGKRAAPLSADAPKIWPVVPARKKISRIHLHHTSAGSFKLVLQGTLLQAQLLRLTSIFEWIAGSKGTQKVNQKCRRSTKQEASTKKSCSKKSRCILHLFIGVPPKKMMKNTSKQK